MEWNRSTKIPKTKSQRGRSLKGVPHESPPPWSQGIIDPPPSHFPPDFSEGGGVQKEAPSTVSAAAVASDPSELTDKEREAFLLVAHLLAMKPPVSLHDIVMDECFDHELRERLKRAFEKVAARADSRVVMTTGPSVSWRT